MNGRIGVSLGLLLLAAGCVLVLSCGDDETTTAPCTNCDYWVQAFGRDGRYPSSCPADPMLIAFCDTMDLTGGGGSGSMYYHIWVAVLDDTTRYHQITSGPTFDLKPVWSPDGTMIAFERGRAGARDIYVVDVTDLENPGEPEAFTDNSVLKESNTDAAWVTVNGGELWLAFSNSVGGGSDLDIFIKPYPAGGDPVRVTFDPSDFAADQNGVLGFVFRDMNAASNGSSLVAFASPDRTPVGDIYVVARSEEDSDTSSVSARVFVNGRDSGETTPALFRYRPVQDSILIEGQLTGYCSRARLNYRTMQADTVNVALLDFIHTHGTLAVTSIPGVLSVVIGEIVWEEVPGFEDSVVVDTVWTQRQEKTPDYDPAVGPRYTNYTCVPADTVLLYAASVYGPCSDTLDVIVTAGDTLQVQLICGGGFAATGAPGAQAAGGSRPVLAQLPEPYSLWVVDVDTGALYLIAETTTPISNPAISPDGRYIAYVVGTGASRELWVSYDVQDFIAGLDALRTVNIGLPGSSEDIECFRFPERVSWVNTGTAEYRLLASLSKCRSGDLAEDYEVWIADVTRFLP